MTIAEFIDNNQEWYSPYSYKFAICWTSRPGLRCSCGKSTISALASRRTSWKEDNRRPGAYSTNGTRNSLGEDRFRSVSDGFNEHRPTFHRRQDLSRQLRVVEGQACRYILLVRSVDEGLVLVQNGVLPPRQELFVYHRIQLENVKEMVNATGVGVFSFNCFVSSACD